MNQYKVERHLTWYYSVLAILLSVSIICIAIPYNHWRSTLDVCPSIGLENNNCACILFGVRTSQYFNGGHSSYCLYAIFAPLPITVYAIIMALFHMYRVCINDVGKYEDEKSTTIEEIEGEAIVATSRARVSNNNDAVIYCWIPTSIIAALFGIYNLIYVSIITHGFLKTCTQYRGYLASELHASGDHVSVIHFRLACQAIFDFMDYLQKDAPNSRRGDFINTAISLQLCVISSWLAVVLWFFITIHTARRAYKEREVLTCCGN
ncbi:hypothetical protein ACJJTC_015293 [Scirpophaga incertulas]